MKIWTVYVDGEYYYASCNWSDACEMYNTLVDGLGDDRVRMEVKKI